MLLNRGSSVDSTHTRSDYFTKYQWADLYGEYDSYSAYPGDHRAHGFYADGTQSNGTMGFWQVFNSYEGYTGGPLRSDLVVDTNIYNCKR